jgi:hypothetical protein
LKDSGKGEPVSEMPFSVFDPGHRTPPLSTGFKSIEGEVRNNLGGKGKARSVTVTI